MHEKNLGVLAMGGLACEKGSNVAVSVHERVASHPAEKDALYTE